MPQQPIDYDALARELGGQADEYDLAAAEVGGTALAPAGGPTKPKPPTPAQPLMDFATRGGQETLAAAPIAAKDIFSGLRSISRERWASAKKLADSGKPAEAVAHFLSAGFPTVELVGRIAQGATMQSWDQLQKAWAATKSAGGGLKPDSNMLPALGHLAGAFPFLGPHVADAWEKYQRGEESLGGALGTTAGTALSVATPAGLGAAGKEAIASPKFLRIKPPRNPQLAADIAWMENYRPSDPALAAGYTPPPLDVGTRSGSTFIRGLQNLGRRSLAGRMGEPEIQAQQQGLADLGAVLSKETATPGTRPLLQGQSAHTAGGAVQKQALAHEKTLGREASQHYKKVEQIQASPLMRETVERTPQEVESALAARRNRMKETLGGNDLPTTEELREMMHIRDELDAGQYEQGGLATFMGDSGEMEAKYTPGHANADVYRDITEAAPGTSDFTSKHMQEAIGKALETGDFSYAAQGALQVARNRLKAGQSNTARRVAQGLEPEGLPGVSKTYEVQMPIDLEHTRTKLQGLYQRLEEQLPVAKRQWKEAHHALQQIMTGPSHKPHAQVEGALSALKKISREGKEVAEAGTKGAAAGIADVEIRELEAAIQAARNKAQRSTDITTYQQREMFDEAIGELLEGRKKTAEKYVAKSLRKEVTRGNRSEERVFASLTQPNDVNAGLLARVKQHTPQAMKKVSRAMVDGLMQTAQEEGFKKAHTLWRRVGPRTREMLFTPEHADALTRYFRLAEDMTRNVNPSGSGYTAMQAAQAGQMLYSPQTALPMALAYGGMTKLLYSPEGAKVLMDAFKIPVKSPMAKTAWARQAGAVIERMDEEDEAEDKSSPKR